MMLAILLLLAPPIPQGVGGDWRLSERVDGASGEAFGYALAVGPDYDGDGWPEILVGAPDRQAIGDVGGVSLIRGSTGQHIWDFVSPYPIQISGSVGHAVSFVPDLNADGFADVLVGDPADQEIASENGRVYVLNGITGGILREHTGEPRGNGSYGDVTGWAVLGIDDVDGDGHGDYAVGSPYSDLGLGTTVKHGKTTLYSGAAGTVIWTLGGQSDGLGWCLARGPDITGDGHPEILATAENGGIGKVHYVDPISGLILQTINGLPSKTGGNADMGVALGTAELDGDGLPDLIAGAPYAQSMAGHYSGYVAAFSSGTRQLLWRRDSSIPGEVFGTSVCGTADLDLDGVEDVLVGVPTDYNFHATGKGYVQVLSGLDGSPLWWFRTTNQADTLYGYAVEAYGRDGRRNLALAGEPYRWTSGPDGALHTVEFLPFLEASALQLSAAAGGIVRYSLAFPASEAGMPYALLASISGRGPTTLGGIQVPLTADGVFARSVTGNYPSGLSQPRGTVDAHGRAQAAFAAGGGALTGQIGRTIHFAAVTHSGGSGRLASIAVPLQILP